MWCLRKHFLVQQAQWHLRRLIFSQVIDHQIQPCLRNDIQQGRQDLRQGSSPDSSDSWMLSAQVKERTKNGGKPDMFGCFPSRLDGILTIAKDYQIVLQQVMLLAGGCASRLLQSQAMGEVISGTGPPIYCNVE